MSTILMVLGIIFVLIILKNFFGNFIGSSLSKSADLTAMIKKYEGDYLNPDIVHELYEYCNGNEVLRNVVRKHNATVKDFGIIYIYLISSDSEKQGGHFLPISTFFFGKSLDYALSRKERWLVEDTLWLRKYFGMS